MKKAFSLIEILFVVFIISLIGSSFLFKPNNNKLEEATERLEFYLKHVRYQALVDDKYDSENDLWHKRRWTLKFLNCRKSIGGIYYSIYSDTNMTGHPSLEESLNDPLTNKKIYSSNKCEKSNNISKYVLLTKEFEIESINISCNETSTIGQLSFGNDGKVYAKLSSSNGNYYDHEIKTSCIITLKTQKNGTQDIVIEPKTGYVRK